VRWMRTAVLLLAVAGCGGRVVAIDAGSQGDAGPADAAPPGQAIDLTTAGGRMSGGTYTLDFQVGHATDQGRATGGTTTIEGGAAVKP